MHRERQILLILVPLVAFFLVATSLYLSSDYLTRVVLPKLHMPSPTTSHHVPILETPMTTTPTNKASGTKTSGTTEPSATEASPSPSADTEPLPMPIVGNGKILSAKVIQDYIDAILVPQLETLERLTCPPINETRYAPLQDPSTEPRVVDDLDYFFALNLRQNLPLLPRLIGTIVEVIRFLGPDRCAVSIVEGNSPDGTGDVLEALAPFLGQMGIRYFYASSEIDPKKGNRIEKLAQLRNLALQPLTRFLEHDTRPTYPTVLFINDVAACPEDILELALQRDLLGADMTCAMDWTYAGADPTFYDVWVARGITGETFFRIPETGSWDLAWNLFWDDEPTKIRLSANQPFQVYSCWNGAVAFTAAPLRINGVRFREAKEGHCKHGEPQNFCKDLWENGYGKIAVVPTVNLEYSNADAARIKKLKGYVSDLVAKENTEENRIEWTGPPEEVRCVEGWGNQYWKPWQVSRRMLPQSWR